MHSVRLFGSKVNERASHFSVTNVQTSPLTPLLSMKGTSLGEGRSGLDYLVEHIRQVLIDFVVGEAHNMYAAFLQEF